MYRIIYTVWPKPFPETIELNRQRTVEDKIRLGLPSFNLFLDCSILREAENWSFQGHIVSRSLEVENWFNDPRVEGSIPSGSEYRIFWYINLTICNERGALDLRGWIFFITESESGVCHRSTFLIGHTPT